MISFLKNNKKQNKNIETSKAPKASHKHKFLNLKAIQSVTIVETYTMSM